MPTCPTCHMFVQNCYCVEPMPIATPKTDHADSVACSELVGSTEGQTLNRPTAAGWWWTRPAKDCLWRIVEITIVDGKPWMQDMGDEEPDILLEGLDWWEWVGPLTPPVLPTVKDQVPRE